MRFLLAALAVLLLILAARGLSRISGPYLARQRPMTGLLIGANLRAFVVAFAAGSAGIIALGRAKSGAVVGVLVSSPPSRPPPTSVWPWPWGTRLRRIEARRATFRPRRGP
jgi:hypothetical protein